METKNSLFQSGIRKFLEYTKTALDTDQSLNREEIAEMLKKTADQIADCDGVSKPKNLTLNYEGYDSFKEADIISRTLREMGGVYEFKHPHGHSSFVELGLIIALKPLLEYKDRTSLVLGYLDAHISVIVMGTPDTLLKNVIEKQMEVGE